MLENLFALILALGFCLFPLLLWGYGNIYLSSDTWNRARFFAGILGGSISIACVLYFKRWLTSTGYEQIGAVVGVLTILGLIASFVISRGSVYIRRFLWYTLMTHLLIFAVFLLLWGYIRDIFPITESTLTWIAGLGGFFIAAYLEEGVKHISSLWLTARDFRFSRTDLLLFTFFVTLGFIIGENILYMREAYSGGIGAIFMTGLYRIFFALPIHILSASICVMLWWKALSYRFFSWRYIALFFSGFIMATVVHSLYNLLLSKHMLLPIILVMGLSYIAFTQWILMEETSEKKA